MESIEVCFDGNLTLLSSVDLAIISTPIKYLWALGHMLKMQ